MAVRNKSVEDGDGTFRKIIENGLEIPKLQSYKIVITITNFQKLNFKNEVYITLKNKSLFSLYSIMKVGFLGMDLEFMILSEYEKAKVEQANMF